MRKLWDQGNKLDGKLEKYESLWMLIDCENLFCEPLVNLIPWSLFRCLVQLSLSFSKESDILIVKVNYVSN